MRSRLRHLAGLVLVAATVAGCGTASDQASKIALMALATPLPHQQTSPPGSASLCTASLRPPATLPVPGNMPAGSFMAKIQRRGYLIAGVNAGLLNFGYFNPSTGKIEGFEIDLVHEIARVDLREPRRATCTSRADRGAAGASSSSKVRSTSSSTRSR